MPGIAPTSTEYEHQCCAQHWYPRCPAGMMDTLLVQKHGKQNAYQTCGGQKVLQLGRHCVDKARMCSRPERASAAYQQLPYTQVKVEKGGARLRCHNCLGRCKA